MASNDQVMRDADIVPNISLSHQIEQLQATISELDGKLYSMNDRLRNAFQNINQNFDTINQDVSIVIRQTENTTTLRQYHGHAPERSGRTVQTPDGYVGGVVRGVRNLMQGTESGSTLEQRFEKRGVKITQLKDAINKLEEEKSSLLKEREDLMRNERLLQSRLDLYERQRAELNILQLDNDGLRTKNIQLETTTAKFREMIVKHGSNTDVIDDSRIVSKFNSLGDQIQHIVLKKTFYSFDKWPGMSVYSSKRQEEFFKQWDHGPLSKAQLRQRTKAMIFELLYEEILGNRCFGLDDIEKKGDVGVTVEHALGVFELALSSLGTGHESDIADWRIITMKCAGLLQEQSQTPCERPGHTADKIWDFMEPIVQTVANNDVKKELRDRLRNLCNSAFELMMLLRRCKDIYSIEMPGIGFKANLRDVELMDRESGDMESSGPDGGIVACALSGTLVKFSEQNPGKRIVLEKARVVVK